MIEIDVNGTALRLPEGAAVSTVVSALTGRAVTPEGTAEDGAPLGVAVAVDAVLVPRARWGSHRLGPGARVEVLTAAQGG